MKPQKFFIFIFFFFLYKSFDWILLKNKERIQMAC